MIALMLLGALALYLAFAVIATKLLVRRVKSKRTKWSVGFASALVFFLIPTWDVIVGKIYLQSLCAEQGGAKIYKVTELGKEYFLSPGEVNVNTAGRLPAKGGELNIIKVKSKFSYFRKSTRISHFFRIDQDMLTIKEISTGDVIATDTNFFYFGGWLANSTGLHVSGTHCPRANTYYGEFEAAIFKPAQGGN